VRRDDEYVLHDQYPEAGAPEGISIPADYPPIRELCQRGTILHCIGDPGVDTDLEKTLGVECFAAIAVGERNQLIIAFSLGSWADTDQVLYTLRTIRHVIQLKLREGALKDLVAQAREIQLSLLPQVSPSFGDYDIWSRSTPAEEVGGDLHDYLDVSDRILGIAVADSAGHGLPAALQARDAIIGLRMGIEENLRLTATIEKLNQVVSRSTLAARFISLFYGELELDGTMVYTNAGHPPPLVLTDGVFEELKCGGLILGPDPTARYRRGYTTIAQGTIFLAYTDGITEAADNDGDMFGVERLKELMTSKTWDRAKDLVDAIFEAVDSFSKDRLPDDDQTVTVVIRSPSGAST
jgi:sigma-B regulation protein RsbU (phosphoserine phosphatase)